MSSKLRLVTPFIIPLAIAGYYLYPVITELLNKKKHDACAHALQDPDKAIKACTSLISSGLEPEFEAAAYNNRGLAHQKKRSFAAAISDFDQALMLRKSADIYRNRADTHNMIKKFHSALADYNKAVALGPANGAVLNNFAWFLATCPSAKHRNGRRAVRLATKALALAHTPGRLDTLAVAFAEAGQFKRAIKAQEKMIALTGSKEGKERLKLYKKSKAYHSPR